MSIWKPTAPHDTRREHSLNRVRRSAIAYLSDEAKAVVAKIRDMAVHDFFADHGVVSIACSLPLTAVALSRCRVVHR
jgi:hypothetical protein